ncbi:MAG: AraC family transcriptional regulator, partial [Kofleriaceae bacterium]|nr:AraC family transcriptional regulator [Kofleriaceae bacterium]
MGELSQAFSELRQLVSERASSEGRNELLLPGARVYRFLEKTSFQASLAPCLTVAVIVQGRKTVRCGGEALTYAPQQFLLLTGEQEFESAVVEASDSAPYLALAVAMAPELVARTLVELSSENGDRGEEPAPAYVSLLDEGLTQAFVRLLRISDDPAELRVLAPLALQEIVFRLLRTESAAVLRRAVLRDGNERRVQEAMAYIREHSHESLTVQDIAKRVAMSPSHFAHRFRAIARVSPMRYVKHVRMHRARLLLLDGAARPGQV